LNTNRIWLNLAGRIRVRDVSESIIDSKNISHCPFHRCARTLWVLEKSKVNNTAYHNIRIIWSCTDSNIIVASPHSSDDQLLILELPRSFAGNTPKFNIFVHLCFTSNVTIDGEADVLVSADDRKLWSNV
jgi:hypothetical protein